MRQILACTLAFVLATVPVFSQQKPQMSGPKQMPAAQAKGPLTVNVLEGEGAKNNSNSRTAVAPVVEVKDPDGKPVAGAEVVFQLPMVGPGGSFNGWLKTQTVRTDDQGKATVSGYTPNDEQGRFNIKVTATSGTQTGTAVIAQSNVLGTGAAVSSTHSNRWKWILAVGVAGALAGGIAAARSGNGNGTSSTPAAATPVSISVGAVGVGGPR